MLASLIAVVDHVSWPTLRHGRVEGVKDQLRAQVVAIRQPTTLRFQASSTTARYSNPAEVGMNAMSAMQSWFGPAAEKSRSTKSGTGRASRSQAASSPDHHAGGCAHQARLAH